MVTDRQELLYGGSALCSNANDQRPPASPDSLTNNPGRYEFRGTGHTMVHSTNPRHQLDLIADQFEAAWRTGARPDLSDFLEQHSHVDRTLLLRELLLVEVKMRQSEGEEPSVEEYCAVLPQDADIVREAFAAVNTVVLTGRNPSVETSADPSAQVDQPGPGRVPTSIVDFLQPAVRSDEMGRLGGYRVLEVLGEGGMGVVLRAEDPQLRRQIVLKTMKPSLAASDEARERFLREARAAAALDHDHIVTIYQVGEDHGVPFIAMQYLSGESLQTRLDRERTLEQAEVVRIGREIAEGLTAAHEVGLIHRDIKPDNIWLETKRDRAKLLDFGLARVPEQDSGLTQSGILLGTPRYMSPEQALGQTVDPRSDLFSLGSVLYHMATGRAPFSGSNVSATLIAVSQADYIPIEGCVPHLQLELAALIDRLLEKDPDQRPHSAAGVVQELVSIASKSPLTGMPTLHEESSNTTVLPVDSPKAPANSLETTTEVLADSGKLAASDEEPSLPLNSPPSTIEQHRTERSLARPLLLGGLGLSLLLFVLGGLWVTGVTFRGKGDQGTLVVRVDDRDLSASARGTIVTIKNLATLESYTITLDAPDTTAELWPGVYEVVLDASDGLRTRSKRFQITQGKESVIEAWWEPEVKALAGDDQEAMAHRDGEETSGQAEEPVAEPPSPQPAIFPFTAEFARRHQRGWAEYLKLPMERDLELAEDVQLKMVFIPPGEFTMGELDLEVTLTQGFYLGETEVTQAQWNAVMGTQPWQEKLFTLEGQANAATFISWEDATEFCAKFTAREQAGGRLGKEWRYDLPTEAQWEYACRAGTMTAYSFGDDAALLGDYAWFGGNAEDRDESYAHAVRQKSPNGWGLYDMHGNVWEWCRDGASRSLSGGVDPIIHDRPDKVIRGGSWNDSAKYSLSACRDSSRSSYRFNDLGFRLAAVRAGAR